MLLLWNTGRKRRTEPGPHAAMIKLNCILETSVNHIIHGGKPGVAMKNKIEAGKDCEVKEDKT